MAQVKAVTMYQASDNSLHDSMHKARTHDKQYTLLRDVKTVLQNAGLATGTAHITLVNDPNTAMALRDALNSVLRYHREYTGKLAKAT